MIDMCVRKDHRVHFARVMDKIQISRVGLLPSSLKQAAVQQEAMPIDLQQMLASRHRVRRAVEIYFQFSLQVNLKFVSRND